MKRALNNLEKLNLKIIKEYGWNPVVIERFNWKKEPTYYAEIYENLNRAYQLNGSINFEKLPYKGSKQTTLPF
jgi:hypothetical protein